MAISAIVFTVILLTLLISYYTYRTAFYAPPDQHCGPDDPLMGKQYEEVAEHLQRISGIMQKIPFETVCIKSFDGLILHGRYDHIQDGAPLEILFHGYRSCVFRDCSGGHALARKMGFNTLVVDQRAHGESEGQVISFGINERQDCKDWIRYAVDRFGSETPILLSGLSMGAATVLMASELDLPGNVVCIVADSPYSAPGAIIEKVCSDMHYPVLLCRPFIHLGALLYGHFRLNSCSAADAVRKTDIPILLIHGEADHFVPCSMTQEIMEASASPTQAHTFPNAGHGLSYITDPRRYEQIVFRFLSTIPALDGSISTNFIEQLEN